MDDALDRHELLLPFDTDDPQFARGFELGRLWNLLRDNPADSIEETVHASNAEMLLRLAEATARSVRTVDIDDTWLTATFDASAALESP